MTMSIRRLFVLILCFFAIAGCSSKYCDWNQPADTVNTLFITQFRESIKSTEENFQKIGEFVKEDIAETGTRLGGGLSEIYEGASWNRAKEEIPWYYEFMGRQIQDGSRDTWDNIKTIGKCFCLCRDEEEEE